MATKDLSCPICSSDIPLAGDEKKGEEVFCTVCGSPGKLSAEIDDDECEVEEDF